MTGSATPPVEARRFLSYDCPRQNHSPAWRNFQVENKHEKTKRALLWATTWWLLRQQGYVSEHVKAPFVLIQRARVSAAYCKHLQSKAACCLQLLGDCSVHRAANAHQRIKMKRCRAYRGHWSRSRPGDTLSSPHMTHSAEKCLTKGLKND